MGTLFTWINYFENNRTFSITDPSAVNTSKHGTFQIKLVIIDTETGPGSGVNKVTNYLVLNINCPGEEFLIND